MAAYDLAAVYRQLSTLAGAGISSAQSFDLLAKQADGRAKRSFDSVVQSVWEGGKLSDAMAAFPRIFPRSHCRIVLEGETTGRLDTTLARLAQMTEHSLALRRALRAQLTNPTITMIVAIPFVIILLPMVAPHALVVLCWLLIALYSLVLLVAHLTINLPGRGRSWATAVAQYIGPLRTIARGMTLCYFARSFALLYAAGASVSPALLCAADGTGDTAMIRATRAVAARLDRGQNLTEAFAATGYFPTDILSMAGVGESAGALDTLFDYIAEIYEQDVSARLHDFGVRMGVLALVLAGIVVGIIVIYFWLAYFGALGLRPR